MARLHTYKKVEVLSDNAAMAFLFVPLKRNTVLLLLNDRHVPMCLRSFQVQERCESFSSDYRRTMPSRSLLPNSCTLRYLLLTAHKPERGFCAVGGYEFMTYPDSVGRLYVLGLGTNEPTLESIDSVMGSAIICTRSGMPSYCLLRSSSRHAPVPIRGFFFFHECKTNLS